MESRDVLVSDILTGYLSADADFCSEGTCVMIPCPHWQYVLDCCRGLCGHDWCADQQDDYLELKRDIADRGIIEPIEVNTLGRTVPLIVDGHHRLTAAIDLGIMTVPVQTRH